MIAKAGRKYMRMSSLNIFEAEKISAKGADDSEGELLSRLVVDRTSIFGYGEDRGTGICGCGWMYSECIPALM